MVHNDLQFTYKARAQTIKVTTGGGHTEQLLVDDER